MLMHMVFISETVVKSSDNTRKKPAHVEQAFFKTKFWPLFFKFWPKFIKFWPEFILIEPKLHLRDDTYLRIAHEFNDMANLLAVGHLLLYLVDGIEE